MNLSDIYRQWIKTAWENNEHPLITIINLEDAQIQIAEKMDTTIHGLWWNHVELIIGTVHIPIGSFRAHATGEIPEAGLAQAKTTYEELKTWKKTKGVDDA